jgi:O-methyltransferase
MSERRGGLTLAAKRLARVLGGARRSEARVEPPDFDAQTARIFHAVEQFTMTSPERVGALVNAVRYIVANDVPGDFVECGVWRGGSSMAAALTLEEQGDEARHLYLYDTFEGMSAPTAEDVALDGAPASGTFEELRLGDDSSDWCRASLDDVRANLASTGYPADRFHYVQGKVEDTLPAAMPPGPIALLRLDTDWYESTRHELEHLYPRLSRGGVLIIDDYGHWAGARKAVDEYFAAHPPAPLLNRVDYTGRIAVKP